MGKEGEQKIMTGGSYLVPQKERSGNFNEQKAAYEVVYIHDRSKNGLQTCMERYSDWFGCKPDLFSFLKNSYH